MNGPGINEWPMPGNALHLLSSGWRKEQLFLCGLALFRGKAERNPFSKGSFLSREAKWYG